MFAGKEAKEGGKSTKNTLFTQSGLASFGMQIPRRPGAWSSARSPARNSGPFYLSLLVCVVALAACVQTTCAQQNKNTEKGYYLPPAMTGNLNPDGQRAFPTSVPAAELTGMYSPSAASLLNGQPLTSPVAPAVMRSIAMGLPSPRGVDLDHPIIPQAVSFRDPNPQLGAPVSVGYPYVLHLPYTAQLQTQLQTATGQVHPDMDMMALQSNPGISVVLGNPSGMKPPVPLNPVVLGNSPVNSAPMLLEMVRSAGQHQRVQLPQLLQYQLRHHPLQQYYQYHHQDVDEALRRKGSAYGTKRPKQFFSSAESLASGNVAAAEMRERSGKQRR